MANSRRNPLRTKKRRPYKRFHKKSECFGELIQLTSYTYRWLNLNNPEKQCMMVLCDNATKIKLGLMSHHFSVHGAMSILRLWLIRYGIPQAVFLTDKKLIENRHLINVLQNLGIDLKIPKTRDCFSSKRYSLSTLGYRFLCELRIHGINTLNDANTFLKNTFSKRINFRLSCKPLIWDNAHVLCEDPSLIDSFFFFYYEKRVYPPHYIFFSQKKYNLISLGRIDENQKVYVNIKYFLNGEVKFFLNRKEIKYKIIE